MTFLFGRLEEVSRNFSKSSETEEITFVSVHGRRTDFANHLSVLYNFTFVEDEYFFRAIERYRKTFKVIQSYNFKPTVYLSKIIFNSPKFSNSIYEVLLNLKMDKAKEKLLCTWKVSKLSMFSIKVHFCYSLNLFYYFDVYL